MANAVTPIMLENTKTDDNTPGVKRKPEAWSSSVSNGNIVHQNAGEEDKEWIQWITKKFKEIAGEDQEINLKEFKEAFQIKNSFFADRFFSLFDKDSSGSILLEELLSGLVRLQQNDVEEKLRFLFQVFDTDGSGGISKYEMKEVIESCIQESCLSLTEEETESLSNALFDAADSNKNGTISFEELADQLKKEPDILENLSISPAQWLKPPTKEKKKSFCRCPSKNYIFNNIVVIAYFTWFVLMNIALAGIAAWNYRNSNAAIIIARMSGLNLHFHSILVIILMLRQTLTILRGTFLIKIFPFDDHVLLHKCCGIMVAVHSLIHTTAHMVNAFLVHESLGLTTAEVLFTTKASIGWVGYSAYITGFILLIVLTAKTVFSMPFWRLKGYFQLFYWTHMLYWPYWILLIIHARDFWHWFVVPGFIFIIEKIYRSKFLKVIRYGKLYIEEVNLLPSGVCQLIITRPANFQYHPGDYVFIQIPAIAMNEWHPFTISSAPEMQGSFWLHIRSAGNWTKSLYNYFKNYKPTADNNANVVEDGLKTESELNNRKVQIRCNIDGPYGTATRNLFEAEHAILIGAGIGITPMASLLQSILYRHQQSRRICPKCNHIWSYKEFHVPMTLQKVDFIWINRDQKSFEWFLQLISNIEMVQSRDPDNKIIDVHLYMTAAKNKTDMKGIGLQMALDLIHKKENKDLITGLKTRTQPGRPNWNKIFQKIEAEKKGKVKVFFCGPQALAASVKATSEKYSFEFFKENF